MHLKCCTFRFNLCSIALFFDQYQSAELYFDYTYRRAWGIAGDSLENKIGFEPQNNYKMESIIFPINLKLSLISRIGVEIERDLYNKFA